MNTKLLALSLITALSSSASASSQSIEIKEFDKSKRLIHTYDEIQKACVGDDNCICVIKSKGKKLP